MKENLPVCDSFKRWSEWCSVRYRKKQPLGNSFSGIKSLLMPGLLSLLFLFNEASAQITSGFELDGNATSVLPNPPDDWDKIYNNTDNAQVKTGIVSDLDNIFQGGGSKDDLDIPNWEWTTGSVPDKDDILHGGVALYDNCKLYFFADRYAINGSSNIGFWLFKNNVSVNPDGTFSGVHTVGDLLLVSEFVNGGGTSVIKAYKWVGTGGNTNGTLDSIPVNGVNSFATTNSSVVASPWPFVPKTGASNQFGIGAFFEGGIDLCSITGLDPCFTSFIIETRSSFAVDAVLKDFLNGTFASTPQITLADTSRCSDGPAVTLTAIVTGGIQPYDFTWNPGGDTTASIVVSPTTTATYTFTVAGSNGCTRTDTAIVTVFPSPNVDAGADDTLNCIDEQLVLNGSSTTSGASFSWAASGGGNIVSGGLTATPTVDAAGTYILTVTANGCSATDTVTIIMDNTPPDADAGSDTTLTCVVTQVVLNGSSTTPGVSFSWIATNGGAILSGENTATPTVQVPGTYVLTVHNPLNGCEGQDSAVVNQNINTPDANAGLDTVLTCTDTTITLNGSSTTPNTTFSWATNNGNIVSGAATSSPVVDAAGSYQLTVTDTVNGCVAMDVVVVTLNNTQPNVNAGVDKVLTCTVTEINLSGSSTTPNAMFSWSASNGGNIVSGGILPTPLVDSAGTYILTVTDPVNGCTASDTALVTLDNIVPDVDAGADTVLTCTTLSVMLNGSSTSADVAFSWTAIAGGNIVSGALTSTATVDAAGTYILTATDTVNGCTATDTVIVTLDNTLPDVDAGADTMLTCTTLSVVLNGSSTSADAAFSWTATAGGNIVSGALTENATVDAAGTYILTVTDTVNGCTATDTVMVGLDNTAPDVDAGADMVLTCTTLSVMLEGSSTSADAAFSWTATAGGNIVSGALTANATVDAAGAYILTVTDTVNGCTATDTVMVTLDNTLPDVDAGADMVITCTTLSVILDGSSTSADAAFSWTATAGGNIVSGALTENATVDAAGTYILTVTDTVNGCTASDTVIVTLDNTAPDVNAGADMVLTCTTLSVMLEGSSTSSDVSFSWEDILGGNIVSGSLTATPVVDSDGTYILTATDTVNGCIATDTVVVTLNNTVPDVDAGADMVLTCTTLSVILDGSSTSADAVFSWTATAGGNIVSGALTANATVDAAGTYILTVADTVNGCTATDTVMVTLDNTLPDVDAGADMVLTCTTLSVILDGSSTSADAAFSWTATAGGNIVSGALTANATVDAAGTYILTVTDTVNGCTASDTVMVTLDNTLPDVDAGADMVITCTALSVMLDGSSTSADASFSWTATAGGNIVSGALTANATVDAAGTYILTVTDTVNGCTATDTVMVTLDNNAPDVDAGPDEDIICAQTQVTLKGSSATPGVTFSWATFGGGNIISATNADSVTVTSAGMYVLTVTDTSNGCSAMDTAVVTVNNILPDVDLGNDTVITDCFGNIVLDAGNAGSVYIWSTGATSQTITVSETGVYYVQVTNTFGCVASDTIEVTIVNPPVDLGPDTTVCGCILLDVSMPGASYVWCSGQNYPQLNVCTTGMYCVTVTNGTCVSTDTIFVTVNTPPVVDLGNDTTVVSGPLMLDAGNPGMSYDWSTGETTQMITVTNTGTYFVTVTDSNDCSDSDTINVILFNSIVEAGGSAFPVNVYPNPSIDKSFNLSFEVSEKENVEINIMSHLGALVYKENMVSFTGTYNKRITLPDVAAGIYFVEVIRDTKKSVIRVAIN